MKKLIKNIKTNLYELINEVEFNSEIHIDRTNSVAYWHLNKDIADYSYIRMRIETVMNEAGGFD